MIVSETLDERGFFQRLRRTQLQLLMRSVGLSYKPSTPAISLARILSDSGELSEADAKLLLDADYQEKQKLNAEQDKKERLAELEQNKIKNLAAAATKAKKEQAKLLPKTTIPEEEGVVALEDMNYLQLQAHAKSIEGVSRVGSIKSKEGLIEAIKAATVEE